MPILVTGATGSVGRRIVADLLVAGVAVRAVTRDPGRAALPATVEVVGGDFTTDDLPVGTFDGVEQAFLFPASNGVDGFVNAARAAGVQHLVVLSSLAAAMAFPRDRDSVSAQHHRRVEATVTASGVPATILRPGAFANNLLGWAPTIRAAGFAAGPYPESRQAPIHEADVAAVAAAALLDAGNVGRTLPLSGPAALTRREQLAAIAEGIGRALDFREQTPEEFATAVRLFLPPEIVTMVLGHWHDTESVPDEVYPTVEQVTGRPGRSLVEWARDHAADFT